MPIPNLPDFNTQTQLTWQFCKLHVHTTELQHSRILTMTLHKDTSPKSKPPAPCHLGISA